MNLIEEPGENLFHYTTREAAFEHILPTGRLRFSRHRDMRDPLEYKEWLIPGHTVGGIADDRLSNLMRGFHRALAERRGSAHLLSLATDDAEDFDREPFWRGWSRGRMWEQYAEDHAGVCLLFNRDALIAAATDLLGERRTGSPYWGQVRYLEPPARGLEIDFDRLDREDQAESIESFVEKHHQELFFTKTSDWSAEHEFRFVSTHAHDSPLYLDFGAALKAVIVGERFPSWQAPSAVRACDAIGATPARLIWHTGTPGVVPLLDPA